jgi:diadenosine tetraphosphate (Ap4A) HIT family hydrolase
MAGWMPREQWDALVRGDSCPLCQVAASPEAEGGEGFHVADLASSRLFLARSQFVPGYCVLVCRDHVREPYELPAEKHRQYFDDLMTSGKAIETALQPIKMNFQILGNAIPHLHTHIVPRYYGDPAPSHPIDPGQETVVLKLEEYRSRIEAIRDALGTT